MTLDLTIIAAKVLELTPTQYFKNIKLNATTITKKKNKEKLPKTRVESVTSQQATAFHRDAHTTSTWQANRNRRLQEHNWKAHT